MPSLFSVQQSVDPTAILINHLSDEVVVLRKRNAELMEALATKENVKFVTPDVEAEKIPRPLSPLRPKNSFTSWPILKAQLEAKTRADRIAGVKRERDPGANR